MTPLRQRFIEDMQLRGLAPTTQRSYLHYVTGFAKYYNASPEKLDLEAIRQYEMYMLNEKKWSPQSVNTFISSVQFLYTVTLDMPWGKGMFPPRAGGRNAAGGARPGRSGGLLRLRPQSEVPGRADALLWRRPAHCRSRRSQRTTATNTANGPEP